MAVLQLTAFAFLVGLTVCGLAGSAMELFSGRPLSFSDPYVSSMHVLRSLGSTLFAGPFMLVNDALEAWRSGRISTFAFLSCGWTASVWTLAVGVVVIDVANRSAALVLS